MCVCSSNSRVSGLRLVNILYVALKASLDSLWEGCDAETRTHANVDTVMSQTDVLVRTTLVRAMCHLCSVHNSHQYM